ncbi:MAG: hypothetical protein ACRCXD_01555, partial [Luteolibacter sp.]
MAKPLGGEIRRFPHLLFWEFSWFNLSANRCVCRSASKHMGCELPLPSEVHAAHRAVLAFAYSVKPTHRGDLRFAGCKFGDHAFSILEASSIRPMSGAARSRE